MRAKWKSSPPVLAKVDALRWERTEFELMAGEAK